MTKMITLQVPGTVGEPGEQMHIGDGQAATFGVCQCGRCELDLQIRGTGLPAVTGQIVVDGEFCRLSNLSKDAPMVLVDMEDWYQYIIVEPGRCNVPVPFELAQIELTASPGGPKIAIFGYEPRYSGGRRPNACRTAASQRPLLDRDATYYSVLQELCRARRGGRLDTRLPTSMEIAEKLRPRHHTISARAVDAHIRYVSEKLRLPKGASRDTLVTVVLRSHLLHGSDPLFGDPR
ncbi:hypothetical protein [Micromonospora cathayae]|uniref:Uncharacterized protein n=1 Tax=Micromonospora cathayae TaxID=3028804 RepID=A0ABY7ZX91_9ACTN|nr:hypothetical protein [Micromonospora sp. HUAS 3]WDZ86618.1 hypothetical protein PVK37_09585 [Micromonospora sp. HUAS 3]